MADSQNFVLTKISRNVVLGRRNDKCVCGVHVRVRVRACVRACVHACVRVSVCLCIVCVCVCVSVLCVSVRIIIKAYKYGELTSGVPCGLVVRIRRSHRRGRGSIPRMGDQTFFFLIQWKYSYVQHAFFYSEQQVAETEITALTVNSQSSCEAVLPPTAETTPPPSNEAETEVADVQLLNEILSKARRIRQAQPEVM